MHDIIRPNSWVGLKLPNGSTRVLQLKPDMYVLPFCPRPAPCRSPAAPLDLLAAAPLSLVAIPSAQSPAAVLPRPRARGPSS